MAVLHRDHVRHVLHHERARLHRPAYADKFLIECIARVREVAGADLAEALAGRAAINDVDRLVRNGPASPLKDASNIPLVTLNLWDVCCVRPAGLRLGLTRRHYLPAGPPRAPP